MTYKNVENYSKNEGKKTTVGCVFFSAEDLGSAGGGELSPKKDLRGFPEKACRKTGGQNTNI